MNNKDSKDNLEDLFRKSFHDKDKINQKDGWNVPSEQVWAGIQTGLVKEKKPRRKFLYWHWAAIAASFLLIISFFQLYQDAQKIKDLSNQLNENEQVVKDIQAQLQTIEAAKTQQGNTAALKKEIAAPTIKSQQILNKASRQNRTTSFHNTTAFNNPQNFTDALSKFDQQKPPFATALEKVVVKKLNKGVELSVKSPQNINKLEDTPSTRLVIAITQLPTLNHFLPVTNRTIVPNIPISRVIKKPASFYLSADYAPVSMSIKRKDFSLVPPNFFPKLEQQQNSFSVGLQLGVLLNKKWAFETGFRYLQTSTQVSHNRAIPFNYLEEQLNGQGNYESSFSLQLNSSGGTVETDVVVARSSSTVITEETQLNFDITFSNSLTYLEIPLILKREFRIGRVGLSLKAGMVNRFLVQKSFNFQEIALDDARFQFSPKGFREHANTRQKPNNYAIQYLVGFGLAYQASSKLAIYAEPTFSRNIKPIFEVGRASIYAQNKSVNIGLRYTL